MPKDVFAVASEEGWDEEGKNTSHPLSNWFIIDALGQKIYIRKRSRKDAQAAVDENYGKGKYIVKADHIQKNGRGVTAK